ncbi:MAG: low molecular weight protein-tyrosine-phosphatase [Sphaerochaeta sp.]
MVNINFICHGNICRSTMAESVMTHLININGVSGYFNIKSSATSREEIGNPPHRGTVDILKLHKVKLVPHRAVQITKDDASEANILIVMDQNNVYNLKKLIYKEDFSKIRLLLSYANLDRSISDPWYTGNFKQTYDDVLLGCKALLKDLMKDFDCSHNN